MLGMPADRSLFKRIPQGSNPSTPTRLPLRIRGSSKRVVPLSDVLIQEGVPTLEMVNDAVAEPVVYMVDRYVVGGFYRVHAERGPDENLNAPGMKFAPLAFDESCMQPDYASHPDDAPNRFYVYGVISRLALLAASLELEQGGQAV